jgi:hypothetical protein
MISGKNKALAPIASFTAVVEAGMARARVVVMVPLLACMSLATKQFGGPSRMAESVVTSYPFALIVFSLHRLSPFSYCLFPQIGHCRHLCMS